MKEVDKYFAHFEKVADSLNCPKESWVLLLQSVLVGKAQEIYGSLSVEQSSNYEHVKEAILKAYEEIFIFLNFYFFSAFYSSNAIHFSAYPIPQNYA